MGREFELKYRADAAALAALEARFGPCTPISMETTYYDTPDLKLSIHQWTLRLRLENGTPVCTFKRPLDDGSRAEWEVPCASVSQAILLLCQAGADWELMRSTAGGVFPLCGARFTRKAATLTLPECTVELALDEGLLTGRKGESPICEVEVELKSGSEEAAAAFAAALAAEYALTPEPLSKFARAMTLSL
ncbi:MAG: CYTH domain-containing protein [Oscillospiraceae bacterium]|nr:CYTH domain-containing protein [Oscillospiraceae bacterium]